MAVITSASFQECLRQEIAKLNTTYTFSLSGAVYEGNLTHGNRQGKGKFVWPNGNTYEGDYVDNKRHGEGQEVWDTGDIYEGSFENDRRHGAGTYRWANGEVYNGGFFNDQRHGKGLYEWTDGSSFDGYFYMNCKEGYGIHRDNNKGSVFEGLYQSNKRLGPGIMTYGSLSSKDVKEEEGEKIEQENPVSDVGFWYGEKLYRLVVDIEQVDIPADELNVTSQTSTPQPSLESTKTTLKNSNPQLEGENAPSSSYFNFARQYPEYADELAANEADDADMWLPMNRNITNASFIPIGSKSNSPLAWISPFITHPPEPVDYDPRATQLLRSRLSGTIQRAEYAAKNNAFDSDLANEEFSRQLSRGSLRSSPQSRGVRGSEQVSPTDLNDTEAVSNELSNEIISNEISWRRWNKSSISALMQNHTLRYVAHTPEHLKLWICDVDKLRGPGLPQPPRKRRPSRRNTKTSITQIDNSAFMKVRILGNRPWQQLGPLERASLLLIAHSSKGNKTAVKDLLDSGLVDVNVSDAMGRTALLEAASHWHMEVIELLLDAGANVNQLSDVGMTPLSACVTHYYPKKHFLPNWSEECITLLGQRRMPGQPKPKNPFAELNHDQQVGWYNEVDDDKADSALGDSRASSAGHSPSSNAPVDDRAAYRKKVLKKKLNNLQQEAQLMSDSVNHASSPNDAAGMEKIATIESASKKIPDDTHSEGKSAEKAKPLTVSPSIADGPSSVPLTKRASQTMSTKSSESGSIAGSAQRSEASSTTSHVDSDKLLEELNEELGLNDEQLAALPDDSHKVLVDYQIPVAQHWAEMFASELSVNQHFLKRASGKEGKYRQKARWMAEQRKMEEIIRLLLRRGADPNLSRVPMPIIFFLVKTADVEMLRLFLQKGTNVNVKTPENRGGLTPLHLAVGLPNKSAVRVVELLLNALADPDARATEDNSFLDSTLNEEWSKDPVNLDQARLLGGKTALQIACSRDDSYKMCSETVQLLLQHHANPQLMCNGHTALTLAIASGNDTAIENLLQNRADASLVLSHGVSSALCVATSIAFEHRRTPDERLALVDCLIKAGADALGPVAIGPKRQQGTFVDYAYQSFNLDKKIAHTPYHALNSSEREVFNARKRMLVHVGNILREKAVEKEKLRLDNETRMLCDSSREGSPVTPARSPLHKTSGSRTAKRTPMGGAESRVSFHDNVDLLQQSLADALTRKASFKYCYECGRSVGVRLTACTRCKEVFFCSKVCKVKAWNARHKDECIRLGGRSPSGRGKDKGRIDSPTQATDPDLIGRRHVTVPSLLRDTQLNKSKNPMKGRAHSASSGVKRLPPIVDKSHPAFAYQFLNGHYVKISLRDQSVVADRVMENYSFE